MNDSEPPIAPPDPDPEIEALLNFEPVRRRCKRHDGWSPEVQRDFIVALARLGNSDRAAEEVGRTGSGAYKVRTSAGGKGFGASWDQAVGLYLKRNPAVPRTGRWRPADAAGSAAGAASEPPPPPADPAADEAELREGLEEILVKYMMKLSQEREARLAGRIVEADFYVRQLSWLEVALDLGGKGRELLKRLKRGDRHVGEIAATPMSVLLDTLRRKVWEEAGEPERPPLPHLGLHDDEASAGLPLESQYSAVRDGDYKQWLRRQREKEAQAAEAQRAWEEKARADGGAMGEAGG